MKPKVRSTASEPAPSAAMPDTAPGKAGGSRLDDDADEIDADADDANDPDDAETDAEADAEAQGRIVERPDGYHWVTLDGRREFGPFETQRAARADMLAADDDTPEPAQTLQEAERDIGIADWIDPLTGEPAEGQSPPHLDEG